MHRSNLFLRATRTVERFDQAGDFFVQRPARANRVEQVCTTRRESSGKTDCPPSGPALCGGHSDHGPINTRQNRSRLVAPKRAAA